MILKLHYRRAVCNDDPISGRRGPTAFGRQEVHELTSASSPTLSRHEGRSPRSYPGIRDLSRLLRRIARAWHPRSQPRKLLDKVAGLNLTELPGAEICCGFGGTFCVKYADISNAIVADKTEDILATGADTLLAGDLGCLMNMAGKLSREGRPVKVRHVAEVLADMTGDVAPISQGPES